MDATLPICEIGGVIQKAIYVGRRYRPVSAFNQAARAIRQTAERIGPRLNYVSSILNIKRPNLTAIHASLLIL